MMKEVYGDNHVDTPMTLCQRALRIFEITIKINGDQLAR